MIEYVRWRYPRQRMTRFHEVAERDVTIAVCSALAPLYTDDAMYFERTTKLPKGAKVCRNCQRVKS